MSLAARRHTSATCFQDEPAIAEQIIVLITDCVYFEKIPLWGGLDLDGRTSELVQAIPIHDSGDSRDSAACIWQEIVARGMCREFDRPAR